MRFPRLYVTIFLAYATLFLATSARAADLSVDRAVTQAEQFSFISLNWQGQPLISYETVVNLIGSTRTKSGLRVKAKLDPKFYQPGVKISDQEMEQLNLKPHRLHPVWNYTISPRADTPQK